LFESKLYDDFSSEDEQVKNKKNQPKKEKKIRYKKIESPLSNKVVLKEKKIKKKNDLN
jgi:hypothetical protein